MEINIIPKFLDEALSPVSKEVGERLADIISLVFTTVIKPRAKRDKTLNYSKAILFRGIAFTYTYLQP